MTLKEIAARLKRFLSTQTATFLILLLAIGGRLIQVLFFFNIGVDRSFQFQATDSLVRGHGITLAEVLPGDLSTPVYLPLIKWPPGYTVLVAPFYSLFGEYYVTAGIVLDMLFSIVLILFSRKVLRELNVSTWLINIYTLVAGFFIYEFYFYSSSDAIVTALFIVALFYTLRFLKGAISWQKASVVLGILLLVLASFKYSFIPALFVIPLFLFIKGWANNNNEEKKVGALSLLIVTVGLSCILLYQKNISGSATYVTDAVSGFYPKNLLTAFPFLGDAFLKPGTLGQLLTVESGIGSAVFILLQLLHLVLGGIVFVYMVRRIKMQGFRKLSAVDSFFYLAFFVSLAIFLLLLTLSFRIAKDTENWTFIQEGRYYGVASVFVHLAFFVGYEHFRSRFTPLLGSLFYCLFFLLFIEGCRGTFFTFNRVRYFGKEEYSWQYEDRLQKYADALIQKAKQESKVKKVAVAASSYYYNHRIHLYSHVPMMHDAGRINDLSSLHTKEPMVLLIMIHEKHKPQFQPFLARKGGESVGNFDGHSFYTVYVTPR
jgi:hypothetical protein